MTVIPSPLIGGFSSGGGGQGGGGSSNFTPKDPSQSGVSYIELGASTNFTGSTTPTFTETDPITMFVTFYHVTTAANWDGRLLALYDNVAFDGPYMGHSITTADMRLNNASGSWRVRNSYTISANTYYTMVVTYDGSYGANPADDFAIYINNTTTTNTNDSTTSGTFDTSSGTIRFSRNDSSYSIRMVEAGIFSTALSSADALALSNRQTITTSPDVAHWKIDDGSGTSLTDSVGSYTLTRNGSNSTWGTTS